MDQHAMGDVTNKQVSDEWAAYAETLPTDLHYMTAQYPGHQAELVATEFEVMTMHSELLSAPPPPEETHDAQEGPNGERGEPRS